MYGYEPTVTLTIDRLRYKLQTHPKRAPQDEEQSNCLAKERKKKNVVMGPKGVSNTNTDRLTDRRSQHQLNSRGRPTETKQQISDRITIWSGPTVGSTPRRTD
jgi:hypothetical protein